MNEWMTTGEMIDRLRVGQVAEPNDPMYSRVKNFGDDGLRWVDSDKEVSKAWFESFRLTNHINTLKWKIISEYVTFEKAMLALKNGDDVTCYVDEQGYVEFNKHSELIELHHEWSFISFLDLINGNWIVNE